MVFSHIAAARAEDRGVQDNPPTPSAFSCGQPVYFVLRQDFSDISLFDCPDKRALFNAVGSRLSTTFDELAHTTSISVDGLVAGVVRTSGQGTFLGTVFGPYLQGNASYQFASGNMDSKTTDTLTGGAFLQTGFDDLTGRGTNYFRIRGGEAIGSTGIVTNTIVGEWLPVYDRLFIGTQQNVTGTRVEYVFAPELMFQYDSLASGTNKYLLFTAHDEALRVGPQVVLKFWYDPIYVNDPILKAFLQQSTVSLTFHSSWDAYLGRNYNWFQSTFTYNLTETGNYAVSASYGCGNSETTGNQTSQIKVGLAAKF
jgi:hypothetical protein